MKKKALVIAPGRGTYNKEELGYLKKHHSDKKDLIARIDDYRRTKKQPTVSELDGKAAFSLSEHSRGDNASPLIYACAYADYLSIDRDQYDVVAVTGNSMGWYIALACGEAASDVSALSILNTTGTMMQENMIGGQMIYSLVNESWKPILGRRAFLEGLAREIDGLHVSIELGGMLVFGGTKDALDALEKKLKPEGRFPMRLQNHSAFHTPLLDAMSGQAQAAINDNIFSAPSVPMIDGRGHVWTPYATDTHELWDYTLGHQMRRTYDFTTAVQVGAKEFAPDCVIILGPGSTLGGAVAQSLIGVGWQGWHSKEDFIARQKEKPYVLSMGMDDQRALVTG